nr:MAG TPA: hypothetical protein [Caudoviricetes sp.]
MCSNRSLTHLSLSCFPCCHGYQTISQPYKHLLD